MAKRGRPKKIQIVNEPIEVITNTPSKTRLQILTEMYQFLLSEGIHSISKLEALIAQENNK